jgi:hypothetical protein
VARDGRAGGDARAMTTPSPSPLPGGPAPAPRSPAPTPDPPASAPQSRGRAGRAFEIALSLYGIAIFTVLWVGFAVGLATGGDLLIDAWAWLTGLAPVAAVTAWILLLPIVVGLWAWNAVGSAPVIGAVAVGLVAWTLVMASGALRTFRRR